MARVVRQCFAFWSSQGYIGPTRLRPLPRGSCSGNCLPFLPVLYNFAIALFRLLCFGGIAMFQLHLHFRQAWLWIQLNQGQVLWMKWEVVTIYSGTFVSSFSNSDFQLMLKQCEHFVGSSLNVEIQERSRMKVCLVTQKHRLHSSDIYCAVRENLTPPV